MRLSSLLLPCVAILSGFFPAQSSLPAAEIGGVIENFALHDVNGRLRSLDEFAQSDVVVVAFLGTECPLAQLYAVRLQELQQRFAEQGVTFLGIDANLQDSLTELLAYGRRHHITFPLLKDPDQSVADRFGAERTPEVFVLDKQRRLVYRGRIDDQYDIGVQRPQSENEFLADAVLQALSGESVAHSTTPVVGCIIGRRPSVVPSGDVTYSNQVARLLNRRCVECHREGEVAPFPLTSFEDARGWAEMILEVVGTGRMPPWHANPAHGSFRNDPRLSDDEKQILQAWVRNGCPEGDVSQLPAAPEFVEGWRIPMPDRVISMGESFSVPATGVVDYQYFTIDPNFTEDQFVVAAEARPDKRAVVHHIIAYIQPPGEKDIRAGGAVIGFAPGSPPLKLTEGRALKIPAGSKLVFEMHYTPNGVPQQDCSDIGLVFADPSEVRKVVTGYAVAESEFKIPPGDPRYEVKARRTVKHDQLLLRMTPHMHLRGAAFRYEAVFPDGTREILLDVPRYDFNWQLTYELTEPRLIPAGTRMLCTAWFNNSEQNPFNPDPSKTVTWGDQSWDEMMIGFYVTEPVDAAERLD